MTTQARIDQWDKRLDVTTKHKPATNLPWSLMKDNAITNMIGHSDPLYHALVFGNDDFEKKQDAAYITHACNAYPKLIDALITMANACQPVHPDAKGYNSLADGMARKARALLTELGESDK